LIAFWCYREERGEKKTRRRGGFALNLGSNVRWVFYFSCCSKPFQRDLQVLVFEVLKTTLFSGFSFSFSISFLLYNECLSSVFFPWLEFRWFFVLKLRVPCFVFSFWCMRNRERGGCLQPTF